MRNKAYLWFSVLLLADVWCLLFLTRGSDHALRLNGNFMKILSDMLNDPFCGVLKGSRPGPRPGGLQHNDEGLLSSSESALSFVI